MTAGIEQTKNKEIYFIGDTHFGHANIIEYDKRPYLTVKEHDEDIIKKWNETISPEDKVYFMGDFSFCSPDKTKLILDRLNGDFTFIKGNHDNKEKIDILKTRGSVYEYLEIYVKLEDGKLTEEGLQHQMICLMHFPILVWHKQHLGSWHVHGHLHNTLTEKDMRMFKSKKISDSCIFNNGKIHFLSFRELQERFKKKESKFFSLKNILK